MRINQSCICVGCFTGQGNTAVRLSRMQQRRHRSLGKASVHSQAGEKKPKRVDIYTFCDLLLCTALLRSRWPARFEYIRTAALVRQLVYARVLLVRFDRIRARLRGNCRWTIQLYSTALLLWGCGAGSTVVGHVMTMPRDNLPADL